MMKYITVSHLYVADDNIKEILSSDIFQYLNEACGYTGGFKSFDGEDDFIEKSYLWYITYDGKLENANDFDVNKCYCVSVYKNKHGLKMVGMGTNRNIDKQKRMSAIKQHIKFSADR